MLEYLTQREIPFIVVLTLSLIHILQGKSPRFTAVCDREDMRCAVYEQLHICLLYTSETTPEFSIGDTIRVDVKIREGERERIQAFEGTVIAKRGSGVAETFTVRRVSYGVGVERVFPLHSPNVAGVKVIRYGKVRRSKLYYLRDRVGKAAKVKEQIR